MQDFVLTSASVTDGHPDKLCDCISDAIVDSYLAQDANAMVVAECAVASGIAFLAVHTDTKARIDLSEVVHRTVAEAGYEETDFDPQSVTVLSSIMPNVATTNRYDAGAWTEAATVNTTVFGFACGDTDEMLPLPIVLAHRLARRMAAARTAGEIANLHPDGQAQVAVRYAQRAAKRIEAVTLTAAPAAAEGNERGFLEAMRAVIVEPVLADAIEMAGDSVVIVSSAGPGGPTRHAGLTGRKNDIDTYGGFSRHGGSALSGKDPSRVDRTGAYAARYAAKNVVAAGLARECEVQISYAMGRAEPLGVDVDTFGSGRVPDDKIRRVLVREIDFSAAGLGQLFGLSRLPGERDGRFFRDLGAFGHVGRPELALPWEATDWARRLADRVE